MPLRSWPFAAAATATASWPGDDRMSASSSFGKLHRELRVLRHRTKSPLAANLSSGTRNGGGGGGGIGISSDCASTQVVPAVRRSCTTPRSALASRGLEAVELIVPTFKDHECTTLPPPTKPREVRILFLCFAWKLKKSSKGTQ
ncbi:hypothetical protein NL676_019968 [Syzygium grande]|nr:hypothetical protein NL676_019968 [Syzygium grande]